MFFRATSKIRRQTPCSGRHSVDDAGLGAKHRLGGTGCRRRAGDRRTCGSCRFPREDFEIDVRIRSDAAGQAIQERQYRILSKGVEQTVVSTLEPAADRGHTMLLKGRDLWVFMPSISQPIRLPLAQRPDGPGSVRRPRQGELHGRLQRVAAAHGIRDGNEHYVLELTAVDGSVAYHRVVYWVEKGTYRPHKAEFYTLSGRRLKTCRYEDFKAMGGEIRPTPAGHEDALRARSGRCSSTATSRSTSCRRSTSRRTI